MAPPYFARICLAFLAVALVPTAVAQDLEDQVRRMIHAARTMDYTGVLVHGMPVGVESMQLYHRGGADGSYRERLVMLTGPSRELVRDGETVHRYHPQMGQVVSGPRRSGTGVFKLVEQDLDRVHEHYRLVSGPAGRVAGREARAVEFRSRGGDRFNYRVWRDVATDLPLQTEVLAGDGEVMEVFMFAAVEPGKTPQNGDLQLQVPEGTPRVQRQPLDEAARPPEALKGIVLPPGFRLDARFHGPGKDDGEAHHLFYTDGLASLSIFLKETGSPEAERGKGCEILQRGALHACSLYRGGYRITLLGELPAPAIRRIANSLEPAPDGGE
jgi:sigma-E factor negative regulatory protein RseB